MFAPFVDRMGGVQHGIEPDPSQVEQVLDPIGSDAFFAAIIRIFAQSVDRGQLDPTWIRAGSACFAAYR